MSGKTVFTLNNDGIHHDYAGMCFTAFNIMLVYERTSILQYIDATKNYYDADFKQLFEKVISEEIKQVPMSTDETILFFSVIHFVCSVLLDENEEEFLKFCFDEDDNGYIETRGRLMSFGTVASNLLMTKFLKNNNQFLEAAENIKGVSIFT